MKDQGFKIPKGYFEAKKDQLKALAQESGPVTKAARNDSESMKSQYNMPHHEHTWASYGQAMAKP